MATARKNAGKTAAAKAGAVTMMDSANPADAAEPGSIEERIRIPLGDGRSIDCRITIASAPKVGPGPRPSLTEMLMIRRIDQEQVLTVSADLVLPSAAISVGSGTRPE